MSERQRDERASSAALRLVSGFVAAADAQTAASNLGWAGAVAELRQVHGADCVRLAGDEAEAPVADAAWARGPGLALVVRTADCVPVLLWEPQVGLTAVVHAGWRGCAAGVVENSLACLIEAGADIRAVQAWIGPAACGDCYEVGPEVVEALAARGPALFARAGRADRSLVDLRAQVRAQLVAGGMEEASIALHAACTMHDVGWPSFRRSGAAAGRLYGVVGFVG